MAKSFSYNEDDELDSTVAVTFKLDGAFKLRQVHQLDYTFTQATDKEGQPTGIPRGGQIIVTVKARDDGNVELLNWMTSASLFLSGKIIFKKKSDPNNVMKTIQFGNAYCVGYSEHWEDPEGAKSITHYEKITIACKEINVEAVVWYNKWT